MTALIVTGALATSPRRERLLAADGRTPVFATVYLPRDYRDDGSFPVIDAMYVCGASLSAMRR